MNMKQIFKTLAFVALIIGASSQINAQEYKISGTIEGLGTTTGSFRLEDPAAKNGVRYEEVTFKKGAFEYVGKVKEPTVYRMWLKSDALTKKVGRGYIPTNSSMLIFLAYPGADIKVNGKATDYCNAFPRDGGENDILAKLNSKLYPVLNEMVNLMVKNGVDTTLTDDEKQGNEKLAEKLSEEANTIRLDFVREHASSVAGLWLMEDMIIRSQIEMEKVTELMEKVDAKYSHLSYFKRLSSRVDGYKTTGIGMAAPMIAGKNTMDGTDFDLSSLKGKYVIIDFWGTWCGACLAGVPEMKKFRDEHSDKLQIVGVAKDTKLEKVKKCMDKKQMNWPNVMVGKGEQDFVAKYNVQGYPTKILLDRNGKILLRSVGEVESFYHEVEKLIKK